MADLDGIRREISNLEANIQVTEQKMKLCIDRKNALNALVLKIRNIENEYTELTYKRSDSAYSAKCSLYDITEGSYSRLADNYDKICHKVEKICKKDCFDNCVALIQIDYGNSEEDYKRYESEKFSLEGQLQSAKERFGAACQEEERKKQSQSLMVD